MSFFLKLKLKGTPEQSIQWQRSTSECDHCCLALKPKIHVRKMGGAQRTPDATLFSTIPPHKQQATSLSDRGG